MSDVDISEEMITKNEAKLAVKLQLKILGQQK